MTHYVITHKTLGIYLGSALGLGFWSLLDCAGQDSAVLFNSTEAAATHIASWPENNNPIDYELVSIPIDDQSKVYDWTDPQGLIEAGLEHMLGEMQSNFTINLQGL